MKRAKLVVAILAAGAAMAMSTIGFAAAPGTEPAYANGKLVNISTPLNSHNTGKNTALPFYLPVWTGVAPSTCVAAFGQPVPSQDPCTPISAINGFVPNCNPCHHFGAITPLDYHDHILAGAPGAGVNGTAWAYNPMWHVFLMLYNPVFIHGGHFTPFMNDEDLLAAANAPDAASLFLPVTSAPVGHATSNKYIWDTTIVFQCNVVSFNAA